jgi:hypothetical protein
VSIQGSLYKKWSGVVEGRFITKQRARVHLVHGNGVEAIHFLALSHIIVAICQFNEDNQLRHGSGLLRSRVGYHYSQLMVDWRFHGDGTAL